jgi:hypothetical protein
MLELGLVVVAREEQREGEGRTVGEQARCLSIPEG